MNHLSKGENIRNQAKQIVLDYMKNTHDCACDSIGKTQTGIFRACGFDWGDQVKAPSTNQQYWVIAILRVLEKENIILQDSDTKKWRMKNTEDKL